MNDHQSRINMSPNQRLRELFQVLDREYGAIEEALRVLFATQSPGSRLFQPELQMIASRLQSYQVRLSRGAADLETGRCATRCRQRRAAGPGAQSAGAVAHVHFRTAGGSRICKARLLPELDESARRHQAQSAYRKASQGE